MGPHARLQGAFTLKAAASAARARSHAACAMLASWRMWPTLARRASSSPSAARSWRVTSCSTSSTCRSSATALACSCSYQIIMHAPSFGYHHQSSHCRGSKVSVYVCMCADASTAASCKPLEGCTAP